MLQLKMDPNDFMQAAVWLSGNIWSSNWSFVSAVLPWIVVLLPFILYKARYLNVLNLGDQLATGLGTAVEKERRILLLSAAALSGACVAAGGNITFLGLVAPHIARRLVGPKHQLLIPASALTGALLFLLADLIGRMILAPSEIPVVSHCRFRRAVLYLFAHENKLKKGRVQGVSFNKQPGDRLRRTDDSRKLKPPHTKRKSNDHDRSERVRQVNHIKNDGTHTAF